MVSLVKFLVGLILLVLIVAGINEWRRWRKRLKAEAHLQQLKLDGKAVDLEAQARRVEAQLAKKRAGGK